MKPLGVILAGGRSTRMGGQDKGLVIYRDRPFIDWILENIRPHVDELLIVANRNRNAYRNHCINVIEDAQNAYQGPLIGILSAMQWYNDQKTLIQASTNELLVVPCDTPHLPVDFVQRLSTAKAQFGNSTQAVYVHDGRNRQPLHTLLNIDLQHNLANYLSKTVNSAAYTWLESIDAQPVDFSDCKHAFQNINSWSDMQTNSPS